MSASALQKTQRDQDALVTVLMINQFFIYVFAFLEIVNNNLSLVCRVFKRYYPI